MLPTLELPTGKVLYHWRSSHLGGTWGTPKDGPQNETQLIFTMSEYGKLSKEDKNLANILALVFIQQMISENLFFTN